MEQMFGPLSFTWKMWVKFQGAGSSECGHVGSGVADVKVCLSISPLLSTFQINQSWEKQKTKNTHTEGKCGKLPEPRGAQKSKEKGTKAEHDVRFQMAVMCF